MVIALSDAYNFFSYNLESFSRGYNKIVSNPVSEQNSPELSLQDSQCRDPTLHKILAQLENGLRRINVLDDSQDVGCDDHDTVLRQLLCNNKLHLNENKVLYLKDTLGNCRTVIPAHERHAVLQHLHCSHNGRHQLDHQMINHARRLCYWPFMERDITEFCKSCVVCEYYRITRLGPHKVTPPIQIINICTCVKQSESNHHHDHVPPQQSNPSDPKQPPSSPSPYLKTSTSSSMSRKSSIITSPTSPETVKSMPKTSAKPTKSTMKTEAPKVEKPLTKSSTVPKSILKNRNGVPTCTQPLHPSKSISFSKTDMVIPPKSDISSPSLKSFAPPKQSNADKYLVTFKYGGLYLPRKELSLPDKRLFLPEDVIYYELDDWSKTVHIETKDRIFRNYCYYDEIIPKAELHRYN